MKPMRPVQALIKNELRECRFHLLAGLLIFGGAPAVISLIAYLEGGRPDLDSGCGVVLILGGAFAALLGVHLASSDLRGGIEGFWRSRPIRLSAWIGCKYLVGGSVILLLTGLALALDLVLMKSMSDRPLGTEEERLTVLYGHSFPVLLLFSVAFLLGCLLREPVKATMLSLAAGLLVNFLPVLVPGLEELSYYSMLDDRQRFLESPGTYWTFVLAHLSLTAAAGLLAWAAVRRGARVELSQKALVSALGGVAVALFWFTGQEIGSNLALSAIHEYAPQGSGTACRIEFQGARGVLALRGWPDDLDPHSHAISLQSFDLAVTPPRLGAPVHAGFRLEGSYASPSNTPIVWSPGRPERAHFLRVTPAAAEGPPGARWEHELVTLDLTRTGDAAIGELDLARHLSYFRGDVFPIPKMHLSGHILYIDAGEQRSQGSPRRKAVRVDLGDPGGPAIRDVIDLGSIDFRALRVENGRSTETEVDLIEVPDLDPRERVEAMHGLGLLLTNSVLEGDLIVAFVAERRWRALETWKLDLGPRRVVLTLAGRRPLTMLEREIVPPPSDMFIRDGLFHVVGRNGLAVFDVRDPAHARRAGHYAAPGEDFRALAPLPGGEVLLAGRRLHVVAPPARRGGPRG